MATKKSPVDYVLSTITENYINFNGRARRAEYWWFVLFNIILSVVMSILMRILPFGKILYTIVSFALLLPGLGVAIRRMHDTDHRGWWLLCPIYNFILTLLPGTAGSNRFGDDPKAH